MFYSISGTLIHTEPGIAVIECSGIGFKCGITANTQRSLPKLGEKVSLFTQLTVREDSLELFGFGTKEEQACFKLLTSVAGVGAKVGLSLLSALNPEGLALAIAANSPKSLTVAQGVGAKLASRIVLELKDRFASLTLAEPTVKASSPGTAINSSAAASVISALAVLGYSPLEAGAAFSQVMRTSEVSSSVPTEELIKLTLKAMNRKN
jgi:Holliday junction DNA helicase RuvA